MAETTERNGRKRAIWIAVAVALLVAAGWYLLRRRGASNEPRFDTAAVQRGRLIAKVTATGTVSALVTVQVGSQVSGRIAKLNVDFNSPVTKDQLIAKIDPQLFEAAVEQSRANYVAAKGNLEKAKAQAIDAQRQAARAKDLLAKKLISQADYDTTETNALAAKAQVEASNGAVEQARAALHQAQINLEYTSIISPINGVVISRSVDVGQTVAASLQAPTLFTIAEDLKKMEVHTNVAEADVGKLSAGMVVTFTVDAYPNERFQGTIRQIRNAAQTIQNVVTYDAVIDVDNRDLKLRPGMTTNVTMIYAERDDVLKVPNAALRFKPPPEMLQTRVASAGGGGPPGRVAARMPGEARRPRPDGVQGGDRGPPPPNERVVWVLRENRPQPVPVKIGLSDGTVSELVDGDLHEAELAITGTTGGEQKGPLPGGGPPRGPRLF